MSRAHSQSKRQGDQTADPRTLVSALLSGFRASRLSGLSVLNCRALLVLGFKVLGLRVSGFRVWGFGSMLVCLEL